MKFFLLLSLTITSYLSAVTYELDLEDYFPNQTILKTLSLEASILQADVVLSDGSFYTLLDNDPLPSLSEIQRVTFSAPEVNLRLKTQSGSELTRSLSSFKLEFLNEIIGERKEISLELIANPNVQGSEDQSSKSDDNLAYHVLKSIFLGNQSQIHFLMEASANASDNSDPALVLDLNILKQRFYLECLNEKAYKKGTWRITSSLFGKGSLLNFTLQALQNMKTASQFLIPQNYYEEIQQMVFAKIDLLLALLNPLCEWEGVALISHGSFDYRETSEAFSNSIDAYFEIHDGDWSAQIGWNSFLSAGNNMPTQWMQKIIVSNPIHSIERMASWVQLHGVNQLATLLEMPSISYYGYYFPAYFTQALTVVLFGLGEPQVDGTLHFAVSNKTGESFQIAGNQAYEIGQLFIQTIKDYVNSWWGS